MSSRLRAIPSVEKVLQTLSESDLPRPLVLSVVRGDLAQYRSRKTIPAFTEIVDAIRARLEALREARLRPVINGTGIIIHTNLGRVPLTEPAADAVRAVAAGYCNLEVDLTSGERGPRAGYLERTLALLSGADAATVVNNCAAALVLLVRHFTGKKPEVIISRSELIQIGGGFRIPEILEAAGAHLREVGTTNKTILRDYANAIGRKTGLILKVHRSNFFMAGFVETPDTRDLAALARRKRVPFVEDLGSGAVIDTKGLGLDHEPTPAEVLKQGVDAVCFSGDKLLGGPQAGIIAGKTRLIGAVKQEPLFRAFRCDKLTFAALESIVHAHLQAGTTTGSFARAQSQREPVTQSLIRISNDDLRKRGKRLLVALEDLPIRTALGEGKGQVGGGALPRSVVPSVTLDLVPVSMPLTQFAERLRRRRLPVIGYVSGGRFKLDLRTIFPHQDEDLIRAVHALFRRAARNEREQG